MADLVKVRIAHEVTWRKTTEFEVDLQAVRDFCELADSAEVTEEHLQEYFEGDLVCGDPVGWVPNEGYGEGYSCEGIDVWGVTYAEDRFRGKLVEVVQPDPQYV